MEITPLPRALGPLRVFPQTQEFWCLNLAEMESQRRNVCRFLPLPNSCPLALGLEL